MGLFGVELRAPSLPSFSSVRDSVAKGLDSARDLGSSALDRASQLGQSGLDAGRLTLADPEGAVRAVAETARQGLRDGTEAVQGGLRDGVMWTGRQIHAGAEMARDAVPGDNVVSNAIRDGISGAEARARFTVGVTGGVLNEGVGLVGTVGTLAVSAAELQVSPTARAEIGGAIVGGLERGGKAVVDYSQAVANDPSRILGDVQSAAQAGYDATAGFVDGQVQRHQDAFARGEGWETLGMSTGQVATYVVPIGGGPVRGLAQGGLRAAARDDVEVVARETVETAGRTAAKGLDEAAGAAARIAPQATRADIDALRARLGVPETHTVAAARTDVPGLQGRVFEGASPKVLKEAGLPQPEAGPISAPFKNPLFVRHAEERVANELARAIDAQPPGTELSGRTVSIHVSQPVCSACKAGLRDAEAASGVLKQLSERYPDLTIRVTAEGSDNALTLRAGALIER